MCVARNHWCEPQLKIPELCSGGSGLAEVVSLGMGVGKWAGSWKLSHCIQTHPQKPVVRIPRTRCWLVCPHFCMWVLAVCHYIFWKFCLHGFHLKPSRCGSASGSCWDEGIAWRCFRTSQRHTHTPHLGQFSSWDENWVQFPENNFSYFNMK